VSPIPGIALLLVVVVLDVLEDLIIQLLLDIDHEHVGKLILKVLLFVIDMTIDCADFVKMVRGHGLQFLYMIIYLDA
jgi:hypothetical protein